MLRGLYVYGYFGEVLHCVREVSNLNWMLQFAVTVAVGIFSMSLICNLVSILFKYMKYLILSQLTMPI